MRIKKFEDLDAWKEARALVKMIYKRALSGNFKKDFSLKDQIIRAAISTMSNIAEGFDSGSNSQFVVFLVYSKRSTSEVQSQLYIAADNQYINDAEFNEAYLQAETVRKITQGLINYLRVNNPKKQEDRR